MIIQHQEQTLHLHPLRGIYWEEQDILFVADLHLGKATHFRLAGISVPSDIMDDNFSNLNTIIETYHPSRVLFLGDLFHSSINSTWDIFSMFVANYPDITFELVQGNHDIIDTQLFDPLNIPIYTEPLVIGPYIFSHYPLLDTPENLYNFHGHIHPGIQLIGKGKQYIKLPCFHFGTQCCVLPAFGKFTGLAKVVAKKTDAVYVIAEGQVIEVRI